MFHFLLNATTQGMSDSPTNLYALLGLLIVTFGGRELWTWLNNRSKQKATAENLQAKNAWELCLQLQAQVVELTARVANTEAEAAKWKARAEAAEIKVDGLQAEVDTLKQQMANHA
jgi:uncharacterized protein HemX